MKGTTRWFNLNGQDQIQPPAVKSFTDAEIDKIRNTLLKLNYPCHNQAVKVRVKVVAEALAQVVEFERDCFVRHFYQAYPTEIQSSVLCLVW